MLPSLVWWNFLSILSNELSGFNVIPVAFYKDIKKAQYNKYAPMKPQIAKVILGERKIKGILVPEFKQFYTDIIAITAWY